RGKKPPAEAAILAAVCEATACTERISGTLIVPAWAGAAAASPAWTVVLDWNGTAAVSNAGADEQMPRRRNCLPRLCNPRDTRLRAAASRMPRVAAIVA